MERASYAEAGRLFLRDLLSNPLPVARPDEPREARDARFIDYARARDARLRAAMSAVGWDWDEWRNYRPSPAENREYKAVHDELMAS